MVQLQDVDRRWFKRFGRREEPSEIRLLCFHHAGGSAGMYRKWPGLLPPAVEPVAVQLPGRADRYGEPPFDRMGPLVEALAEVLEPLLDRPFACYGVSMGSRVAWALTHLLRDRSMPTPSALYLACDIAPSQDGDTYPWEGRADGLEGYLREMGGTPPEVLAEPELVRALVRTLRADLTVLSTHRFRPAVPLDVRIHAFAGTDDLSAPPDQLTGWEAETTARFDLDVLRSGHFFDADAERQVIERIGHDLARDRRAEEQR
jgi:medium-chain acyl-[acyl-carrier-protein] hydrolase